MPNWVYNNLTAQNDAARAFQKDKLLNDENNITFNKLAPMPEILGNIGNPAYVDEEFSTKKYLDMGYIVSPLGYATKIREGGDIRERCVMSPDCKRELKKAYGDMDWYSWRLRNWGTKWEPTDLELDGDTYRFNTAWDPPFAIIYKLAQACPEGAWYWSYEEENGWGGAFEIKNGCAKQVMKYEAAEWVDFTVGLVLNNQGTHPFVICNVTGGNPYLEYENTWIEEVGFDDGEDSPFDIIARFTNLTIVDIEEEGFEELMTYLRENEPNCGYKAMFDNCGNSFSEGLKEKVLRYFGIETA